MDIKSNAIKELADSISIDNVPADSTVIKAAIEQPIDDKIDGFTEEINKKNQEILHKIYENGMTPGDALGVTKQQKEWLYGLGYQFYERGKLENACLLFRFLAKLDPSEVKYPMGVGGCYMQQKKYELAIEAFMQAASGRAQIPDPWYYMAECYMKLDQIGAAMICYGSVIQLSGDNPKYAMVKQRSDLTMHTLAEKISKTLEKI
jgi:type III secretion system low calcium response chaperone LcrH/SycD